MAQFFQILGTAVCLTMLFLGKGGAEHFSDEDLAFHDNLLFTDRDGEMLRFVPDSKGQRHLWTEAEEIPDHLKKAFIAIEDERFYSHRGVDLKSILRALRDNIFHGKVISGASTLTQQTVRLIYPHPRTLGGKLREMSLSGELEERLSKDAILEQYLNRVPLGPGIVGVGLASRVYFDRKPSELSVAQAAVLAALPKAPSQYSPYGRKPDRLLERKDVVLAKMASLGFITDEQYKAERQEPILFRARKGFPNHAPHVVELLRARRKHDSGIQRTTIDLALQHDVEQILTAHKGRLAVRGAHQAAVMVVRNQTMEVLTSVGSVGYSEPHGGFNNGTTARRSAGSTLKPFLYAAALERGYTASSLLEDVLRPYKTSNGFYSPDNFDRRQYGPVTMRTALGNSLNISSVKLLETIRLEEGYDLMRQLRLMPEDGREAGDYGIGLAIGNAEVTLEGLVTAYATLANGGTYRRLRYLEKDPVDEPETIFSEQTAYIVTDILSDPSSRLITFGRALSFPFRVAVKTGTSTMYRDCWAVGYTPEYTIGVWVGNFEGTPTDHLSGSSGAVPIFKEILRQLYGDTPLAAFDQPKGLASVEVCGISGMRPGPKCTHKIRELFIAGTEPDEPCNFHRHEEFYHELPTTYAGWLYERDKQDAAGGFRLAGFPTNLKSVFGDPADWDGTAVDAASVRVLYPRVSGTETLERKMASQDEEGYQQAVAETGKSLVRITYPLPDDHFILNEAAGSTITFQSVVTTPVAFVDWFVNGMHQGRTGPPYQLSWELERGRHRIIAVTPDRRGDSIEITVE